MTLLPHRYNHPIRIAERIAAAERRVVLAKADAGNAVEESVESLLRSALKHASE